MAETGSGGAPAAAPARPAVRRPQYCGVGNTNFDALGFSLKHVYYDGRLFPALMQRLNAVLRLTELGPRRQGPKIGEWLRVLQAIGLQGNYGAVFSGMVGDAVDAVVVKMNRDPEDYEDLRREFRVQEHLNTLRQFCPNFVLALAAFACGGLPKTLDSGTYLGTRGMPMCAAAGNVEFLVIERVQTNNVGPHGQSLTMQEFAALPDTTVVAWLALLTQTLLALRIAQRRLRFTHYDLHLRNLMVQGLDGVADFAEPATHAVIHYDIDGDAYNVRTPYIAVMIDFGLAHIVTPDGKVIAPAYDGNYADVGITPKFSAAYDPFMLLAVATANAKPAGAKAGADALFAELQDMLERPDIQPSLRPGLLADGRPDGCSGLDPAGGLALLRRHFPAEMAEVFAAAQPGDVRLPADLSALEAHYDCGTANTVVFPGGRRVDLAPPPFVPPGKRGWTP